VPNEIVYLFVFSSVVIALILYLKNKPSKHLNSDGYIVLADSKELEHRFIAKQLLGRDLYKNEVVHHINGRKTDNEIANLCLMDRQRHELFHSWLRWKKEKSGKYPPINHQKNILKNEYDGILLEKVLTENNADRSDNSSRRLFHKLRAERKRLALNKGVPVYIIFNNKTLMEMSENLPTSQKEMLQISGVNLEKMRLYGNDFIKIVNDFKKSLNESSKNKQNSA
jgi:superfamily II DNA helicase RecQ